VGRCRREEHQHHHHSSQCQQLHLQQSQVQSLSGARTQRPPQTPQQTPHQPMQIRSSQGSASDASSLSRIVAASATKVTATAQMSVDIRFVADVLPMENRVASPGRRLVRIEANHQDSTRSAFGSAGIVSRRGITASECPENMIDLDVHLLGVTRENERKERQVNRNCILLVHATCGE